MNIADRFVEILHMNWDEFVEIEQDENITSDEAMICGLIRACAEGDMRSIKTAFARSDGEVEIPVHIKVPKFYVRYINATSKEQQQKEIESKEEVKEEKTYDIATAKLRETLNEMRKAPKKVVTVVLGMRERVDGSMKKGEAIPPKEVIPMVKSVISANLLHLAGYGNSSAVTEVFDQIDGKLAKTITLLGGEDVYVDNFITLEAPAHATKDKDGYYIAENKAMTNIWIQGFAKNKNMPQLALGDNNENS